MSTGNSSQTPESRKKSREANSASGFSKRKRQRCKAWSRFEDPLTKRHAGGQWHTEDHGNYRFVDIDRDRKLVLVSSVKDSSLTFQLNGRVQVWPLDGPPIKISGVEVTWEKAERFCGITLWSPSTHALQTIHVPKSHKTQKRDLQNIVKRLIKCLEEDPFTSCPTDQETLTSRMKGLFAERQTNCVFLCCCCPHSVVVDVVRCITDMDPIFGDCRENAEYRLQLAGEESNIIQMDALEEGIKEMMYLVSKNQSATIMIIGGKNTGKSTTVRHLVNSLLLSEDLSIDSVGVLDCDPGQTEFTPPAFVSVTDVMEPLFGPPFTHCEHEPVSQYFLGSLSPSNDPSYYMQCVTSAYHRWIQARGTTNVPLIINTMGWVENLGRCLLVDTIRVVKPALVLQLRSSVDRQNFERSVSATEVMTEDGWQPLEKNVRLDYKLHIVDRKLSMQHSWRHHLSPTEHRNMTLYGHLSKIVEEQPEVRSPKYIPRYDSYFGNRDLLNCLLAISPVRLPWKNFAIHSQVADVPLSSSVILLSINACLVAFSHLSESQWQELVIPGTPEDHPHILREKPLCEALGIGLIRAVDPVSREILVVSALSKEVLMSANCILSGRLDFPMSMVLPKLEREKDVPYIGETVNSGIGRTSIRKERPHLKIRKHDNE